jgi:hypothetical protein
MTQQEITLTAEGADRRTFSDGMRFSNKFTPVIAQICGKAFIRQAPKQIDCEQATDLVVLGLQDITIACRIRRYSAYQNAYNNYLYRRQFTIRTSTRHGINESELEKIMAGWCRYYFYGFADEKEAGLIQWFIGDLNVFRKQVYASYLPDTHHAERLRWEEQTNGPNDTDFNAYYLDLLPREFFKAWSPEFPHKELQCTQS